MKTKTNFFAMTIVLGLLIAAVVLAAAASGAIELALVWSGV